MSSEERHEETKSEVAAREKAETQAEAEAEAQRISKATVRAEAVLAGLLEWVGKTDSRTAFLFTVNTALGGFALGSLANSGWSLFDAIVFVSYFIMFGIVSFNLVMVQYPNVTSPNRSMLFFGTIAGNPSDDFIDRFSSMKDDEYLRDVLHQCHVNSLIVQKKFKRLQRATLLLIISSFVWLPLVAAPTFGTPAAQAFFGQLFSRQQITASNGAVVPPTP